MGMSCTRVGFGLRQQQLGRRPSYQLRAELARP
jgi:hypothetical protein